MKPNSNLRHVLLCVTGLTPQVVTETLYALHQEGRALPEHIHILTTREGAERARLTLINDHWLNRFYQDYQLAPVPFGSNCIHVLQDRHGEPLQDIRSGEDNQAVADGITETIRTLTANPETALHVSIAGGRKTMGFYAGYALSLYGRPQDRLSHVLVSADYEAHPQFYYPTPHSQVIYGNDPSRKPLDTRRAAVILADIAFVRLRHGLDRALLDGKSSFSQSVQNAQRALSPASLIVDLPNRCLVAQGIEIKPGPADLAFYLWLLTRQLSGQTPPTCPFDGSPEQDYAREYLRYYRAGGADRTIASLRTGMSKSFFEQRKSRVNKALNQILNQAAPPYLIVPVGSRPRTRYRIALEPEQIQFQQETLG
jgi:CRISPR-associated protein (TIGR02584 family)